MQRKELEDLDAEGREIVADSTGNELVAPDFLIGFQKDQSNNFISTADPFNEEYDGEWEQHTAELRTLVERTYRNQGLNCELSKLETEEIGGLDFQTFSVRINASNGATFEQRYYYRLINGALFGVAITSNNEELGVEMQDVWRSSEFEKTND